MTEKLSTYLDWQSSVPVSLTGDVLWKITVYRLALFACDSGWKDVCALAEDRRTAALSDQLNRALGSISANIAEGYSRGGGKDRARFYEYALGSARESRDWYYKARQVISADRCDQQMNTLTEIIRLLLRMIPGERTLKFSEPDANCRGLYERHDDLVDDVEVNGIDWSLPLLLTDKGTDSNA